MAREGGDDWVEDRFYKGNRVGRLGRLGRVTRLIRIRLGIRASSPTRAYNHFIEQRFLISKYTATHFLDPFDDAT